jgi:drug/metabolite transporter (DMT)-like permease
MNRPRGTLLVLLAALCWSTAGLIVRHIESRGLPVVFARSAFMALSVGLYLTLIHRQRLVEIFRQAGRTSAISGLLLGASFVLFILAITEMPVANAYVLMSASPLVSALLGRWWLGERLSPTILAAILIALFGIGVMFADGMGPMSLTGALCAAGVALAFGANVVLLRRKSHVDMVPSAFLGGLFSAFATLPFAQVDAIPLGDLPWLAVLGFVQLGAGLILFVHGTRHLPSAEASLLTLAEAVMAPVWVWLAYAETPGPATLLGGLIVLGAVVLQTLAKKPAPANRG